MSYGDHTPTQKHACPLCDGTGRYEFGTIGQRWMECPDCIEGYPKEAVERASKAYREAWFKWWRNGLGLEESKDPEADALYVVAAAIRAFLNEDGE